MIAVIYAKNSGMLRRAVRFDLTTASFDHFKTAPGEAVLFMHGDIHDTSELGKLEAEIERTIGRPIVNHVCAFVVDGVVERTGFMADPDVDTIPGGVIVSGAENAQVGDQWSEATGFVKADA